MGSFRRKFVAVETSEVSKYYVQETCYVGNINIPVIGLISLCKSQTSLKKNFFPGNFLSRKHCTCFLDTAVVLEIVLFKCVCHAKWLCTSN